MSFHEILYTFISSFLALFPVMNPIGNGLILNSSLADLDHIQRRKAIKKLISNCLLVGIGSLIVGHLVLLLFGLAVPVIQIGGGVVICKTALEWLSESSVVTSDKKTDAVKKMNIEDVESKLFYPLAFPIAIGPGSISVIFTLLATASSKGNLLYSSINYFVIALGIMSICLLLAIILLQGPKITKRLGSTGNRIINKMIAFITFCIGIQILVTGISKTFHISIL